MTTLEHHADAQKAIEFVREGASLNPRYATALAETYDLLRRAVNDSTDECLPGCSSYGHEEKCPSCDPAYWLVDQQSQIAALTARLTVLADALAFYADAANWKSSSTEPSPVEKDAGSLARAALEGQ